MLDVLRSWSRRRWIAAVGAAVATVLIMAVPTALIPTPVFGREIPPTAWAWPVLVVSAVLGGLLFATYVREPRADLANSTDMAPSDVASAEATDVDRVDVDRVDTRGTVGALLTFFAVGCPVCNKLVLLALGYTGAIQWFAPVQPFLAAGAIVLLGWALVVRLRGQVVCRVPSAAAAQGR